jgi:hypothetical protein
MATNNDREIGPSGLGTGDRHGPADAIGIDETGQTGRGRTRTCKTNHPPLIPKKKLHPGGGNSFDQSEKDQGPDRSIAAGRRWKTCLGAAAQGSTALLSHDGIHLVDQPAEF